MAQSADDSFTRNARALWRFGWLIVIGACIAALVPMLMLYKPKWPADAANAADIRREDADPRRQPNGPVPANATQGRGAKPGEERHIFLEELRSALGL